MIRITGREAVTLAHINREDWIDPEVRFFIAKNDREWRVPPDLIRVLIEDGEVTDKDISCEIPSIWDLVERKNKESRISYFKDDTLVVVFAPLSDRDDCDPHRISPFAVLQCVFDRAEEWARSRPAKSEEEALFNWIERLNPRIYLRRGFWKIDPSHLLICGQLSRILESLYGIEPPKGQDSLDQESEESLIAGLRFDRLLDAISAQYQRNNLLPPPFCLSETGREVPPIGSIL